MHLRVAWKYHIVNYTNGVKFSFEVNMEAHLWIMHALTESEQT